MEKELRKALRGVLDKVHIADLALDEIMTKESEEILAKYPVKEGHWSHPNSHYMVRIKEFLTVSKKTLERVISALPKERKPSKKNDKKVVFEDKNNEKTTKKLSTGEKNRDTGKSSGSGSGTRRSDGSSSKSAGRKPRKPRSDKGKRRKS